MSPLRYSGQHAEVLGVGIIDEGIAAVEGDHVLLLEERAVRARQSFAQDDREAAGVHLAPQCAEQRDELRGVFLKAFEQRGEGALVGPLGPQADAYYDQVLRLFGQGAQEGRFAFAADGSLRPAWNACRPPPPTPRRDTP